MDSHHDPIKLTAAELSYLWTSYITDSMSVWILRYFRQNVDDQDIKTLLEHAIDLSQQHIEIIKGIFIGEVIQVPQGFTENDVNLRAKRLFSDVFYLKYIRNMAKGGLVTYGRILQNVYRQDIRSFYSKCLTSTLELDNEATNMLLEKGLDLRPPTIPYPKKLEFIHKQSFILEALGRRESLTGTEITNLHANIETNQFGTCIAIAFSQVAQSDKVRQYLLRGKNIALKHIEVFRSYMEMNSLPVPMSIDQEVTDSTESPFSDKLMMFHFSLMIYAGIGNYGIAISESQRTDLVVDYSRLTMEILKYSEDGSNLMIANEWLEQPPLSADRKSLAKKNKSM
ncbi:DUF3231 family protein [Bacillus sp. Marseille-P3661]|uniref:DUF3231 family protein n=1 Tax=Bacillus sp. Marseille-P3661 TaxID=1936234 RepID=UPI000C82AEDB|nr:DUF3231 family protein [Bacillus sp. Marseille-P3661]